MALYALYTSNPIISGRDVSHLEGNTEVIPGCREQFMNTIRIFTLLIVSASRDHLSKLKNGPSG